MMLQGVTVQYLIRRTYRVKTGDTILIHAAAGGVGLILCQWAKHLGATVIGTVSTPEKAELARAHGCTHPIVTREVDFVASVKAITNGAGLPVVYDPVGRDTFSKSLDRLAPFGLMVLFGQASGAVAPIDPNILQRGSWPSPARRWGPTSPSRPTSKRPPRNCSRWCGPARSRSR